MPSEALLRIQPDGARLSRRGTASMVELVREDVDRPARPFGGHGVASTSATQSWTVTTDTFYSLASDPFSDAGGPTSSADAILDFSTGTIASGVLAASSNFTVTVAASASGTARETGPLTTAAAARAEVRIPFADVDSPTLVRGNTTAEGIGLAGLIIEAFDGATLVDATTTGDDGSDLLSDVTASSVIVRVSDPLGRFLPTESGPLSAPMTFDFDLAAAPAVSFLEPFVAALLVLGLVAAGGLHARTLGAPSPRS